MNLSGMWKNKIEIMLIYSTDKFENYFQLQARPPITLVRHADVYLRIKSFARK